MDIGTLKGYITLEDSATGALKTFQTNLQKIGSSFTQAGATLSVGLTAPLVAAASASLYFAGTFEASMTRLVSLAGTSQEELAGVKQHILDLAPAVGVGPQALADAMMKISSTVDDTKVAMELLDASAKGSAAGMGTALDVAGALTAVVNSYGKENISAAKAADILTKAVQDGGAEAKELAPTLANVVPIAAQLGISFTEVAANIATVTKLGVPAAEAVTQLSSVMSALLKETKQGKEALGSVGMTYDDLRKAIKERGLADVLIDLTQRFGENKTGLTEVFGRVEALRNVMSSAGQQATTYANEIKRIGDSTGALDKAFDAMKGTQLQTWGEVSAALQVAAIKFGDSLAPAMGRVLNATKPLLADLTSLVDWFGKLPTGMQTTAIAIAGLAAVAGPLLIVVGSIATGVAALTPLLPLLGAALAVATGPVGLAALAVGGLAAAVLTFQNRMKDLGGQNLEQPVQVVGKEFGNAGLTGQALIDKMHELNVVTTGELPNGFSTTIASVAATSAKLDEHKGKWEGVKLESKEFLAVMADLNSVGVTWQQTIETMDGSMVEAIQFYQSAGVAQEKLAAAYGVTAGQLDAINQKREYEKTLAETLRSIDSDFAKQRIEGLTSIQTAETALNDFKHQQILDATSYEILKIWEVVDANEKAFKGSADQRVQYNAAIEELAEEQTNKLLAASGAVTSAIVSGSGAQAAAVGSVTQSYYAETDAIMAALSAANALNASVGSRVDTPNSGSMAHGPGVNQGPTVPINGVGTPSSKSSVFSLPGFSLSQHGTGGYADAGRPTWVGDRGPEIFVPPTSGEIAPNDRLGGPRTVKVEVNGVLDPRTIRELTNAISEAQMNASGRKF